MELKMETKFDFNIHDSNLEIVNYGYREGLTPKTKKPIYYVGILAKIKTFSQSYRRQVEVYVTFWTTIGPDTKTLNWAQNLHPGYKAASRLNSFKKKFPNRDIPKVVEATGISVGEHFAAHHSFLIITDWYTESAKGNYI